MPIDKRPCHFCGEAGHISANCPKRKASSSRPARMVDNDDEEQPLEQFCMVTKEEYDARFIEVKKARNRRPTPRTATFKDFIPTNTANTFTALQANDDNDDDEHKSIKQIKREKAKSGGSASTSSRSSGASAVPSFGGRPNSSTQKPLWRPAATGHGLASTEVGPGASSRPAAPASTSSMSSGPLAAARGARTPEKGAQIPSWGHVLTGHGITVAENELDKALPSSSTRPESSFEEDETDRPLSERVLADLMFTKLLDKHTDISGHLRAPSCASSTSSLSSSTRCVGVSGGMGLHSDEAPAETLAESAVIAVNNETVDELWSPHLVRTSASTSYGRHISSPPAGSQPAPVGDRGNPSGGASGRLRVGAPGAGGGKDGDSGEAFTKQHSKKFEESLVNNSDLMKENGLDDDFQELMKTQNDENKEQFLRKEGSNSRLAKGTETKSFSKKMRWWPPVFTHPKSQKYPRINFSPDGGPSSKLYTPYSSNSGNNHYLGGSGKKSYTRENGTLRFCVLLER